MQARALRDEGRVPDALHQARRGVKLMPGFAPGTAAAAELAQQQGKQRQARRMLEDAWRAAPHPELARAYAQLVPNEAADCVCAESSPRLKSLRPDHPELHVALGELAIVAQQWDAARASLERALALEPTVRVYRLLAELERASGNPGKAEEWLARGADATPDNAWVCEDTGEVLAEWQPFGASGRFDVVRWTTPPRLATLHGHEHGAFLVAEKPPEPTPEPPPPPRKEEPPTTPPPPPAQAADRPAAEMATA